MLRLLNFMFWVCVFCFQHAVAQSNQSFFLSTFNKSDVIPSDAVQTWNRTFVEQTQGLKLNRSGGGGTMMVPLVFHVIHLGGPENVSDSMLLATVDALNAYFSNAAPFYDTAGFPVNIQFCLASIDPWGNPTNGITRDSSIHADVIWYNSDMGDESMKNVNRWNPYRYLNVWIVRQVVNYANAYATLPGSLGTATDGVVITGPNLGGIHYLIAHECGHYLGLLHHNHSGNCINYNCLLDGDGVCDTPPEAPGNYDCTVSSCSTEMDDTSGFNPFTMDVPDLSTLMQPKLGCGWYFTQGQAQRMEASLQAFRTGLLQSHGCGQIVTAPIPNASITHQTVSCNFDKFVCAGTNVEFVEWDINNDGYFEYTGDSIVHQYTTSGWYTVVMRAFGETSVVMDTLTLYVYARPTTIYPLQSISGAQPGGVCRGATLTYTAVPGMLSYEWFTGDTTQSITYLADSSFYMWVKCIDSTGYVWQRCPDTAMFNPVIEPPLEPTVYALSEDSLCWWDTLLVTADLLPGQWIDHWIINNYHSNLTFPVLPIYPYTSTFAIALVIRDSTYCKSTSDTAAFYIDPQPMNNQQPYTMTSFNGTLYAAGSSWNNQFYLDGVPIPGATSWQYVVTQPGCYTVLTYMLYEHCAVMSDSICFLVVGDEMNKLPSWHVKQEHALDGFTLMFEDIRNIEAIEVSLHTLDGRFIESRTIHPQGFYFWSMNHLASGTYFLRANAGQFPVLRVIVD